MARRHHGENSTGGGRQARRPAEPDGRPAPFEPAPSTLALLRGIWARRDRLSLRERDIITGCLRRAPAGPITPAQLDAAIRIGRAVGVGYDAPDEPGEAPARKPAVQPWGPLPLKPPGRA